MAFGQAPGPPASARQLEELLGLLRAAGYRDFREARGPLGFSQRQGGGRFTRDEAAACIEQLQDAQAADAAPQPRPTLRVLPGEGSGPSGQRPPAPAPVRAAPAAVAQSSPDHADGLGAIDDARLAAELRRRGWRVSAPSK